MQQRHRPPRLLTSNYLSKRNIVTIKILYAKFLDSIGLESQLVINPGITLIILNIKSFDIVYPKVNIPHLLHDTPVRNELHPGRCLAEHDGVSVASNHAEIRRLAPQSIVGEAQFISKVIRRCPYIPNKQDWSHCLNLSHIIPYVVIVTSRQVHRPRVGAEREMEERGCAASGAAAGTAARRA